MCADAPDMTAVNEAAKANAEIGKEALSWYKEQWADGAGDRAAASGLAREQSGLQNDLSREQLALSREQMDRYRTTFQPIEDRIASEAQEYDTPQRREAAATSAVADSNIALAAARDSSAREMARHNVDPSSARALGLSGAMDLGAAKMNASAANTARERVETVGAAKLSDAAAMGRGVFTNQGTSASLALTSGNSAVGNGATPLSIANQGAQLMGQGFSTGIQANSSAGSLYNQAATAGSGGDGGAAAGAAIGGIAIAI